jgi:aspartate dehydrogenase
MLSLRGRLPLSAIEPQGQCSQRGCKALSSNGVNREASQRLAVIGFGAITQEILRALLARGEVGRLESVLVRPDALRRSQHLANGRFVVTDSAATFFKAGADLVIEAAGQGAVAELGPQALAAGIDLVVASTGALADPLLARKLRSSASASAEVWIAPGAVAGIDGLFAARSAGLSWVRYTSLKPPQAWIGTPAESLIDADAGETLQVFFEGSARDAALRFPQNANVAATIGLAGLGLDRTEVRLGVEPRLDGPLGIIDARGEFGTFHFEINARATAANPKTSMLTGHSLVAAALGGTRLPVLALLDS